MSVVVLEARAAREGGGLALALELFPRVARHLETAGHDVVTFIGPPASLSDRLHRRRAYSKAAAILHAGNRATPSRARRVVCVQDRLRLETGLPAENNTLRFRVRRLLLAAALAVADVIVVPSRSMVEPVERFRRRYRIGDRRCEVILHGRPDWSTPPPRPLGSPMRLLFPSSAMWHKNFPLLAGLLERAVAAGHHVHLTITGSPEQVVDGKRLVDWFGDHRDRVGFLGFVERAEVPALYETHDVLLFPSLIEAFGLPLVEAMVMNMPIVASDLDWAREVCGPAALYRDPTDPHAWVGALEEIRATGTRANPAGIDRATQFDWDRAAKAYAALLGSFSD